MKLIAYQVSPTGVYKLLFKISSANFRTVIVDDVHGLGDLMYDADVKVIDSNDVDGINNYIDGHVAIDV